MKIRVCTKVTQYVKYGLQAEDIGKVYNDRNVNLTTISHGIIFNTYLQKKNCIEHVPVVINAVNLGLYI